MEKLKTLKLEIVGFKVGEAKAKWAWILNTPNDSTLGKYLNTAFHQKNCDFVTVRKIDLDKHEMKP